MAILLLAAASAQAQQLSLPNLQLLDFARMYGLGGTALERVLPGARADNYGFI